MSDDRDELAALEAELDDEALLRCPVCRLEQPPTQAVCGRCGADLTILAEVLTEASERRLSAYQAILHGDTVGALDHLERIRQLTGSTLELAVLRRLIRHGTVPIEVAERFLDSHEAGLGDGSDPGSVYEVSLSGDNELQPPLESPEQAAFAALLERHVEPEPEPEPQPEPEPVVAAEPQPAPQPAPTPAPPPTVVPAAPTSTWLLAAVAVVLAILLGFAAGRLSAHGPAPAPAEAATMQWRMEPMPGVSQPPAAVTSSHEPEADASH